LAVDVVPRRLRPFTWRRVDYRLFFLSLTNGKVRHPATMTDDAPGAVSSIVKLQPNKKDCNTSGTHRLARLCTNYVQTTWLKFWFGRQQAMQIGWRVPAGPQG